MKRTSLFMTVVLVGSVSLFRAAPAAVVESRAPGIQKPNIVFVPFDDMGDGQPTCYDPKSGLHTPNMDLLASEGMYSTAASVCTLSRYAVLGQLLDAFKENSVADTALVIVTADNGAAASAASMRVATAFPTWCAGPLGFKTRSAGANYG